MRESTPSISASAVFGSSERATYSAASSRAPTRTWASARTGWGSSAPGAMGGPTAPNNPPAPRGPPPPPPEPVALADLAPGLVAEHGGRVEQHDLLGLRPCAGLEPSAAGLLH